MNILMTNIWLNNPGGTETWTYTMACEWQRRGHAVTVFTPSMGRYAQYMAERGLDVADKIPEYKGWDLIQVNHAPCLSMVRHLSGYKIFTSHGPLHPLEQPRRGADVYVGVSQEVRDGLVDKGFWDAAVIHNGVDLQRFRPVLPAPGPVRALVACKSPVAANMALVAGKRMGWEMDSVHYAQDPAWDMAGVVRGQDVVIGCGRTALEGLACGCEVLVFDARGADGVPRADGWLTLANIDMLRRRNLSTRTFQQLIPDVETLETLMASHTLCPRTWQRPWAEVHANIEFKTDAYQGLMDWARTVAKDTQYNPTEVHYGTYTTPKAGI